MKSSAFAAVVLIVGYMALGLCACGEKIRPSVLQGIDTKHGPQQESWHSTVIISDSGKVQAKIIAGYIRKFDNPPGNVAGFGSRRLFLQRTGKTDDNDDGHARKGQRTNVRHRRIQ